MICSFQIIYLASALESQSCLWFNGDVASDSSGLALRQQGDSLRSSIWVLHSCCPYTLPSQRSRDTTVRQPQSQTVVSCPPAGVRGVRNTLTELRVMAGEANGCTEPNNPIPHRRWSPLQQTLHSIEEEEGQRSNSVSVNTRGPVYNKY